MWRSVIVHGHVFEEEGSATSSTFSSEESFEYREHTEWNPCWNLCVTLRLVLCWEHSSTKYLFSRVLDMLCVKTSFLLVVNDNVSLKNWPRPLPLYVVKECANDGACRAANDPALMRYVMDVSPWIVRFRQHCPGALFIKKMSSPQGILQQSSMWWQQFPCLDASQRSRKGLMTGGQFNLVVAAMCCVVIKTLSQDGACLRMVDLGVW